MTTVAHQSVAEVVSLLAPSSLHVCPRLGGRIGSGELRRVGRHPCLPASQCGDVPIALQNRDEPNAA